jgi:hypothetical protein
LTGAAPGACAAEVPGVFAKVQRMHYDCAMIDYAAMLEHLPPELREPVLQLVRAVEQYIGEELAALREQGVDLRALTNGLLESQQASLQRLEAVLILLAEAMQRTETHMAQLVEALQRTETRMEQLVEARQRTDLALAELASTASSLAQLTASMERRLAKAELRLGAIDSLRLEQRYVERAYASVGRWLDDVKVLWPDRQLERNFQQQLATSLSREERNEVLRLDAILSARLQPPAAPDEIYVALAASVMVNEKDVKRVHQCAALLRRLGVRVVPVVAGDMIGPAAVAAARRNAVAILSNDVGQGWEEALSAAQSSS